MRFHHAVVDEFAQLRQQPFHCLDAFQKFDAYRQMLAVDAAAARRVQLMVRAESGARPDHGSARHAALEQQVQNVAMQKIVRRTRIFIEMDDHLLRGAG